MMPTINILNTFSSIPSRLYYYSPYVHDIIYEKGPYKIYYQSFNCYLYTFNDIAISQLAGINKDIIDNIINEVEPLDNTQKFLYNRIIQNKQKGLNLKNQ